VTLTQAMYALSIFLGITWKKCQNLRILASNVQFLMNFKPIGKGTTKYQAHVGEKVKKIAEMMGKRSNNKFRAQFTRL